ncbi:Negative regulator of mitotic exit [Linnemannia schmuckeri]|uniref:Negative regulator of mitotic exit n=1 Tax=Linnemannia schmuckeri TaxID=64567 RepID=A0A9P5VAC6_9FUNG|nr:Negative regulator of mitotic exit [Linnemannia schmuckeri]
MAGLFTKKKKEDPNNNANNVNNSNSSTGKQRPAPPPNGLGLNNPPPSNTNNAQQNGGYPSNNGSNTNLGQFGYNDNNNGNQSQGYQQPPPAPPTSRPMNGMNGGGGRWRRTYEPDVSSDQWPQYSPASSTTAATTTITRSLTPTATTTITSITATATTATGFASSTGSSTPTGTDIFLYGGCQFGVPKGDLYVIDSVSLQCQLINPAGAEPPIPKSGHTAVNIGQYIIFFGGWDPTTGQCDDTLHVYHTIRKEWNRPPIQGQLPTPRHSHSGCNVGSTMYIFGGQVDNYYLGDIVAMDMKTITQNPRWEVIEAQTESPPARSGHSAAVYDGKIYIFGGADADYFYNDIWCFDTRALTWTPIPASGYLPTGRHGHSCTIVEGVLYIFGGSSPDGSDLNDAYAFRIHERRWYLFQNVGPAPSPRSGHTMCTVKDKLFIIGGESEQSNMEDPTYIYYLEIPNIRFSDSPPAAAPRQVSSAKLVPNRSNDGMNQQQQQQFQGDSAMESESDRNSGQPPAPGRPERPDRPARPDRPLTQRPASPATFGKPPPNSNNNSSNLSVSQQTSQLMNPQLGQRPLTMGTPPAPARGASSGFQNSQDYQEEGLSIAARRQTLKEDLTAGYGSAVVIGMANPVSTQNVNRNMQQHQLPNTPPPAVATSGANSSPLRVLNDPSDSPMNSGGETNPALTRTDRRTMNGIAPAATTGQDDMNPYAMDAVASAPASKLRQQGGGTSEPYIPPPPGANSAPSAGVSPLLPPPGIRQLPPPPNTPSPPVSAQIILPPGAEKKTGAMPPPPPQALPPTTSNRAPSPAPARAYARTTPTSPPATGPSSDAAGAMSPTDIARVKQLESQAESARDANERLLQQMRDRDDELARMKRRENWLVAEVILARQNGSSAAGCSDQAVHMNNKRLSMADLEKDLENQQLQGHQLMITRALVKVKEDLRHAKMSIATQAQTASFKIKEAERVRTGALQEAAYLKAKLSALSNARQDPGTLAKVEMERAADLEKRLTLALAELETVESQYAKTQESLQQERMTRHAAEERSNGSTILAEQAQAAHTRALAELASLHSRAAAAEAESRDYAAQLAESQAGFSGHQSQSSGMLEKITDLKQQVEELQSALHRTQMAYAAANERAVRAETICDDSSEKLERLESLRSEMASELTRSKNETERLQSKVEELEGRWQISKDEVVTLRKLVEDGLGAFHPRGQPPQSPERKHDSIAILSTVSKVSELEHELSSLKSLHKSSQAAASKSAAALAEAMIELSQLEQSSLKARAESLALQKMLADEREGSSLLRNELTKVEQDLETKVKELENNEVQLGLLKDVMREKGIMAEDVMQQAAARGSGDYAATMERKVRESEGRVRALEKELEETQDHFTQQLEAFEAQRQATVQHSEKTGILLRKIKNDLATTMQEKDSAESQLKALQETHARCGEMASTRNGHAAEESRKLASQVGELQNRLMESEMHSTELTQKVLSMTERMEELETLNEAISEEIESMQSQAEKFKIHANNQEMSLKSDIERLVNEVHQAQAAAAAAASSNNHSTANAELVASLERQCHGLEQQLKKAQEAIQILEGDNSVLEARLQDSEKKVTLLLEDMQNHLTDPSQPASPISSINFAGIHQQLNHHQFPVASSSSPSATSPHAQRLKNNGSVASNGRNGGGGSPHNGSGSGSPHLGGRTSANGHSPSGLQINKNGAGATAVNQRASPSQYNNTRSNSRQQTQSRQQQYQQQQQQQQEEDDDVYAYGGLQQPQQQQPNGGYMQGHSIMEEEEDVNSRSYRDSVDSITRELEMLKVPWNKNTPGGMNQSGSDGVRSSPLRHQQPQQAQKQQTQQQAFQGNYYGNGGVNGHSNGHVNGNTNGNHQQYMYNNDDDSEDEDSDGISYLAHLQQRAAPAGPGNSVKGGLKGNGVVETRSSNDRSPSRLKEYEQMIDEIENSRRQH